MNISLENYMEGLWDKPVNLINIALVIIAVALASGAVAVWLIIQARKKRGQRAVNNPAGIVDLTPPQFRAKESADARRISVGERTIVIESAQELGRRESQQDAFAVSAEQGRAVCAVCDGMGGMAKGEESAQLAALVIMSQLEKPCESAAETVAAIENTLKTASSQVYGLCRGRGGSTAVVAVIDENGLVYGAAGDSRIYLLRDGMLNQLGQDHIFYYDLLRTDFTPKEAAEHPESEHLTSFIGREELTKINSSGGAIGLAAGDMILIVSDGIYKSIDDRNIVAALSRGGAGAVVEAAMTAGNPAQDNATAVSIKVI